ncbi:aspartate aminotransferase family protein, partial [Aliarcobacter butzleri]
STFGGNYLVTSTGLEDLNIIEELKDSGRLDETIIHFTKKLDDLYEKNKDIFITHVDLGLMRGLRVKIGITLALLIKT